MLVTRVNAMSLEDYMQQYLRDALGIENLTFNMELNPDVERNLVHLAKRGNAGIGNVHKRRMIRCTG